MAKKRPVRPKPKFAGITLGVPVDPEVLAAAGRVALAHAHLEYVMKRAFGKMTGSDLRATLITTNKMAISQVRETLRALVLDKNPGDDDKRQLKSLLTSAEKLSSRRNKLIHRAWASTEDGKLSVKGDDHRWGAAPTVVELNALADELDEHCVAFTEARLSGVFQRMAPL